MTTPANPTNPFASNLPVVQPVTGIFPKPTGITMDANTVPLPYAPSGGYSAPFGANLTLAITGLTNALALSTNNVILTFNTQELTAMQNTLTLLTAIHSNSHASPFPFTQAQLQDMFVSLVAINNSQNSGSYIVANDLANNNVAFFNANTGFFPEGAQTIICNDQYMIAEQPGTGNFFWSNNANGADWSVLNVGDMEAYSDVPVAVDQFSGLVVVFGIQSIQFYVDGGAGGNIPESQAYSAPQQGTTQNIGLAAIFSRAHFMNSIAFLGQLNTGQAHIYMFSGYTPSIISTPDIDALINSFTVIDDAVAYAFDYNGHSFCQWTFPTANRTLVYDGTTQVWLEFSSGTMGQYGRHLTSLGVTFNGTVLASDAQTGNVYILDASNSTDNGFLFSREIDTTHVNIGGDMLNISKLKIDLNTGETIPNVQVKGTLIPEVATTWKVTPAQYTTFYAYSIPNNYTSANVGSISGGNNTLFGTPCLFLSDPVVGDNPKFVIGLTGANASPAQNVFDYAIVTSGNGSTIILNSNTANVFGQAANNQSFWRFNGVGPIPNPPLVDWSTGGTYPVTLVKIGDIDTLKPNPMLEMYYSTDHGNTWKGPLNKELGAPGEYYKRVVWRRIGRAFDFIFKFIITDAVPFVIARAEAVIKPGKQ